MDKADAQPAIGISINHQIADDRSIVFQGFVPSDCDPEELNGILDKLVTASERQRSKVRLPQVEKLLGRHWKAYARLTEDLVRIDAERDAARELAAVTPDGRRLPAKLSAQQIATNQKMDADRGNATVTITRTKEEIDALTVELEELRADIGEG